MTGIVFNGLNLNMADPTADGWRLQARVDGTDWGNGDAVITSVMSQLQDGDLQAVTRWGNREAVIEVRIDALTAIASGNALALGQKAIELACRFPNQWAELLLTSDLPGAATSVVEVVAAIPEAVMDYRAEFTNIERVYRLTLRARPFVRATTLTTIAAPSTAVTPATTVIDDGTDATAWSLLTTSGGPITNFITNPSFTANANDWSASVGTIARAIDPTYGSYRLKCTPGPVSSQRVSTAVTGLVGGMNYYFRADVTPSHVNAVDRNIVFRVDWYQSASLLSTTMRTAAAPEGTSSKNLYFVDLVAPSGADNAIVSLEMKAPVTFGSDYWWIDRVAFVNLDPTIGNDYTPVAANDYGWFEGIDPPYYFPDDHFTIKWSGTPNNSTSLYEFDAAVSPAVASGTIKATQYGNSRIAMRRTATVDMTTTPYMRIKGKIAMTPGSPTPPRISIADNGTAVAIDGVFKLDATTGEFDVVVLRPGGFTTIDILANFVGPGEPQPGLPAVAPMDMAIDLIEVTNVPYASGAVQSRQIAVAGSQRTDLSLSILGLDSAGDAVGLGEMIAVYSGTRSNDGRQKFLAARAASGLAGTADTDTTSGFKNTLSSTPTTFSFPQNNIVPGSYLIMARLKFGSAATASRITVSHAANAAGNPDGATSPTYTTSVTFKTSGVAWPQLPTSAWGFVPLCVTRLPWADGDNFAGDLDLNIAALDHSIDLDDMFLFNIDAGQLSLIETANSAGSFSAVTLNAATVNAPQASVMVGSSTGSTNGMLTDSARWIGEQHQAEPGMLQIATITPGCASSAISASYFARYLSHVAQEN